jgi:hypothetical protein
VRRHDRKAAYWLLQVRAYSRFARRTVWGGSRLGRLAPVVTPHTQRNSCTLRLAPYTPTPDPRLLNLSLSPFPSRLPCSQAAKQYVPGAALELATRYLRAQGVRRCPEHAVRWLRKAASARTRARGSEAEQGGRDGEEERQQARRILAALAHDGSGAASNLKALDAMFPASLAPRRTASVEEAEGMQRAMRELQEEMGLQLQRARDRAAAAAHKRTRDDVVPGVHLGRRLEEALEDASLAAVQALSLKKSGGGGG